MATSCPGILWPSAVNDEELHALRGRNAGTAGTAGTAGSVHKIGAAGSVLKIGAACPADWPRRWSSVCGSTGQSTGELTDAVEPAELKDMEPGPNTSDAGSDEARM